MKLFKWSDLVFTAAIVAAAIIVWVMFQAAPAGERAVVTLDGKQIASLPLDRDTEFTVRGQYTNVLQIKDGRVFVLDTDCPNKICQKEGSISKEGQSIICVPNKMTVAIQGGSGGGGGVDAVSQ